MDLQGISAVVTGGASGLGAATCRRLAEAGAMVVVADLQEDLGEAVAAETGGAFVAADVTDAGQLGAAVAAASEMGPLRALVNCAGIGPPARTLNRDGTPHDLDRFEKVIAVNLIGTFNAIRLAAVAMARTHAVDEFGSRGAIVNTASVAAFDGQIGQAAYSASKGGIVGMTLPVARDLAKAGIRVCTIAPGLFGTPLLMSMPEAARNALAAHIPFPPRLGHPPEFAALAVHILENPMLNGETIRLDGAVRMPPR